MRSVDLIGKQYRQLISSLAVLLFLLGNAATPVRADQWSNFWYQVDGKSVTITQGYGTSVVIPDWINGLPVTRIADLAFNYANMTRVTLSTNVISIGNSAFSHCPLLTNVVMPEGLVSIGNSAFDTCPQLTNFFIPKSVTTIGARPFFFCSELTNILVDPRNPNYVSIDGVLYSRNQTTLIQWPCRKPGSCVTPPTLTSIGDGALAGCSLVTNMVIGSGVTNIGIYALEYCSSIPSITVPTNVIKIGDEAFRSCSSLKNIGVDAGNLNYKSVNGVLFDRTLATLIQCPGGRSGEYGIPNTVTNIGTGAFANCAQLTNVIIPNTVMVIGNSAFSACTGLPSVTIPNSVVQILDEAFGDCSGLSSITIPDSVASLGAYAFYNCYGLTNAVLGNGVISLGDYLFVACSGLKEIFVGSKVTYVANATLFAPNLAALYFTANASQAERFWQHIPPQVTIYHTPWSSGWTSSFHGHPTALWDGGTHDAVISLNVHGSGAIAGLTDGQLVNVLSTNTITAVPAPGYALESWTSNLLPTSDSPSLTFMMLPNLSITANFIDRQPPTTTILSPQEGEPIYSTVATVKIAVSDNGPISNVWVRVGNQHWVAAIGDAARTNWTASIIPPLGTNVLSAYAMDAAGNLSPTSSVSFIYTPDRQRPKLAITSPKSGQVFTNSPINVMGTVSDARPISNVWVRIGAQDWLPALIQPGQTNWTIAISPPPGTNTLSAFAVNAVGNTSTTTAVQVAYIHSNRLNLSVTGLGTLSPNYSNAMLQLGRLCSMTATPAKGYLFSNWTGSAGQVLSTARTLRFTMTSDLALTAHFVVSPFPAAAGTYQGLFTNIDGAQLPGSGFFNATVRNDGTFSGSLQQGVNFWPITGSFPLNGVFATSIGKGANTRIVSFYLDLNSPGVITGTVSGVGWRASLVAARAAYSKATPAPQTGKYTIATGASTDSAVEPGGHGYGNISVNSLGNVTLAATLGDGTKVSRSSTLSPQGLWPVYIPLYGGKGAIYGWLSFTNADASDIAGTLTWTKGVQATAKPYPSGFTVNVETLGSRLNSQSNPFLSLTNRQLVIEGADFAIAQTNAIVAVAKNSASGSNTSGFIIMPASGLFTGKITNQLTHKVIPINGAVLQKANAGYGLFKSTNQTGSVVLIDAE